MDLRSGPGIEIPASEPEAIVVGAHSPERTPIGECSHCRATNPSPAQDDQSEIPLEQQK
jgi:hypothetical protein